MILLNKHILYLLLIVNLSHTVHAQTARSVEKKKKYQNLQVVEGNTHYEFQVLAISKKKPAISKTYTWYLNNVLNTTQGNYSGKLVHGSCTQLDNKTNMLVTKGEYKYGQKTGQWLAWNEAGKLTSSIEYKHGLKQGWAVQYDESGNVLEKTHYKKNILQGKSYKYVKGVQQESIRYKKGEVHEKKSIVSLLKKSSDKKPEILKEKNKASSIKGNDSKGEPAKMKSSKPKDGTSNAVKEKKPFRLNFLKKKSSGDNKK